MASGPRLRGSAFGLSPGRGSSLQGGRDHLRPNAGALSSHEDWESCARCPTHGEQILHSTVARMPPTAPARCRTQCYSRAAVHSSPSLKKGAARKVRRDSRPAIIFNSRCAPIMAKRSRQASMVRAFFIAASNTCVRLSIIASPRSFDDGGQRANPRERSAKSSPGPLYRAAGKSKVSCRWIHGCGSWSCSRRWPRLVGDGAG